METTDRCGDFNVKNLNWIQFGGQWWGMFTTQMFYAVLCTVLYLVVMDWGSISRTCQSLQQVAYLQVVVILAAVTLVAVTLAAALVVLQTATDVSSCIYMFTLMPCYLFLHNALIVVLLQKSSN